MKRPLSALGTLIILLHAVSCGGRTDLSEFLTGDDTADEDDLGGSGGLGPEDSPTSGQTGGGGHSTGGALIDEPGSGGADVGRCPEGEFDVGTDLNSPSCRAWSECKPGEYVALAPALTNDRLCQTCPQGTFSTSKNQEQCEPWSKCSFGATVTTKGTSTSDLECQEPDTFAAVPFDEELQAAAMTATMEGIYLGLNLASGPTPVVLRQTIHGTEPSTLNVPSEDGGRITDLTSLASEVYVALLNHVANGLENQTARVVRYDSDGKEQVWVDFQPEPDEWLVNVLVTSDGADLLMARQVLPVDCSSGSDCAPGVESHVILSRFDHDFGLIAEARYAKYFNFGAIGDIEAVADRIFLSGELTGNSGIHAFGADLSVLKKYDDFETGGNIGYVLAPSNNGSVFGLSSEADPIRRTLAVLDGTTAQVLGDAPHEIGDSTFEMLATDQELLLLGRASASEQNVFTRTDHQGSLIDERVEEKDFTYLTEMVQAPNSEVFVGGVGDDGERHVGVIRPWSR